jgi:hypothetical protein
MNNLTIGRRIFALVGFLALVIAGTSTLAVVRIRSLDTISQSISGDFMPGPAHAARRLAGRLESEIRPPRIGGAGTAEKTVAAAGGLKAQSLARHDAVAHAASWNGYDEFFRST